MSQPEGQFTAPSLPSLQRPAARRGPGLAAVLLAAMLLIVLLSVGMTFLFSSLAVQREFHRLPPEVQSYLRAVQAAARQGQVLAPAPPVPEIRLGTATDRYLRPGQSSPGVYGLVKVAGDVPAVTVTDGLRDHSAGGGGGHRWNVPQTPYSQDFLQNVQGSLLQVGLISALASALLAWALARRVAQPITAVSRAAAGLAGGDLSIRAPLLGGEREITELAVSFNEMARSLQTLDAERQRAVADIAHELRTPLAVMQARLDALEDGIYPLNTEQIALLSAQTQLLTRLVGDLRTLTLADAGRLALNLQDTDLSALARSVLDGLQDRATAQGVVLECECGGPPLHLRADPDRLRQVITNLAENALRHAQRQVRLTVGTEGGRAALHVDDDGSGIPAAQWDSIFTRFTRLDESRARDTGGSGLGLAIVRALALAHGGEARAGHSPLGGARLSVWLPLAALDSPGGAESAVPVKKLGQKSAG